jgi:hypothetical protein
MESFSRLNLQAMEVDAMAAVELHVTLGKIVAHHADQLDRAIKAGGDGRVAGRSAEEAGIFGLGSFDRVEGGGTDNQDAHGKVK